MKNITICFLLFISSFIPARAGVLDYLPGPDDEDQGMIMPEISITGHTFSVYSGSVPGGYDGLVPPLPQLKSLNTWSPGNTFQPTADYYSLLDPVGGNGGLFNCQYGFTSGGGTIPSGESVGIRLVSRSSDLIQEWNYWGDVGAGFHLDPILSNVGSQVLWQGTMWHTYFTLPSSAAPGIYSETFEFFVAKTPYTAGTGYGDYSPTALAAAQDTNYIPVDLTLYWQVAVPEPSTWVFIGFGMLILLFQRPRRNA